MGFTITKEIINTAKDGNSGYLQYVGTIKPQTKNPPFNKIHLCQRF